MKIQHLKSSHFKVTSNGVYVKNNGKPGMILFWAEWCGFCTKFKPTYEQLCKNIGPSFICTAIEHTELGKNPKISETLGVRGYPTLMFFDKSGKITNKYNNPDRSYSAISDHICKFYNHCVMSKSHKY